MVSNVNIVLGKWQHYF